MKAPRSLDATYATRAIPRGSKRYWSWLFADAGARPPLLGIYALWAEWSALMDVATERSVAEVKLAWWHEEIGRLSTGRGVHPISLYLQGLPGAARADFAALDGTVSSVALQIQGAPLESASQLEPHAHALFGVPLMVAARLCGNGDIDTLATSIRALAVGTYLADGVRHHRREFRGGRVPFPVDELLAAGIENDDLAAPEPSARLQAYLSDLRQRAERRFSETLATLPPGLRASQRHLSILAAVSARRLVHRDASRLESVREMFFAWKTARRTSSGAFA